MTNVAMIGLGFGAEFIPIYQAHPDATVHAICRRDEAELHRVGDQFGIDRRYTDYDDVLADPDVDFVHINTPIPDHAWMSLAALDAGKHVMCTVPMATTIDDCRKITEKVEETGLKYMMAETVVYSREFLFIKELYEKGELGEIQHLAASHPQDMDGWPSYWERMIPMHYATRESFDVYGTKKSFEWTLIEDEPHVLHTAKKPEPEIPEKIEVPDYAHLLPEPIRKFTLPQEIQDTEHLSFIQGGGHGGSHPHLANEFLSALREDRDPRPNAVTSANWTCVGICAHESAMKGGEIVRLPDFTLTT